MARIHTDVELAIEDTRSVYGWDKHGDRKGDFYVIPDSQQSFFGRESRWNGPFHCLPGDFRLYFRGLRGTGRSAVW
jgi:hypothetical protein